MKLNSLTLKKHLNKFADDINRHEVFTLAGSLAYTTALALAPFILILLSLASLLGTKLQEKLYLQLASSVGEKAGVAILQIVQNAKKSTTLSGISGLIGFLILIVSASAIFAQLRIALNKINDHQSINQSGMWIFFKDRFLSMGLVFGFAFLSIASLMVSITLSLFLNDGNDLLWESASFIVNIILFTALFTAIYRVIPSDKLAWSRCRFSGFVSAIFYLIGKNLIGLYLATAGVESAYGAAGSLIAFLIWVYYTALTLLISYEFTKNIVFHGDEPKIRTQL